MEKRDYFCTLFDVYGKLLSEKMQYYFKKYYFEDLSIVEIATKKNISKAYVSKILIKIQKKLEEYEKLLKIVKLKSKIKSIINSDSKNIKEKIESLLG